MPDGDKAVNAANANYKMWQSLGFAAQFAIGATFPNLDKNETVLQHFQTKLLILTGLLLVGGVLVFIITGMHPPDEESQEPGKGLLDDYEASPGNSERFS